MKQDQVKRDSQLVRMAIAVVAIGWMFVILIPVIGMIVSDGHHHDSLMGRRGSEVRSLNIALAMYAGDHEWVYPSRDKWSESLIELGYREAEDFVSFAEDGDDASFVFVPGPCDSDSTKILVYENPDLFEDGVVVGFRDTHTETVTQETFERMLAEQLAAQEIP